jgi:hypothetical protein
LVVIIAFEAKVDKVFLAIHEKDKTKKPPCERPVYPIQQIILLTGCSSAAPVSSSDLHRKDKKYWLCFVRYLNKISITLYIYQPALKRFFHHPPYISS